MRLPQVDDARAALEAAHIRHAAARGALADSRTAAKELQRRNAAAVEEMTQMAAQVAQESAAVAAVDARVRLLRV